MKKQLKKPPFHANIDNKLGTFKAEVNSANLDLDKLLFVGLNEMTEDEYEQIAMYLFQDLYD